MRTPSEMPGARGRIGADVSFADDAPISIPASLRIQAIPETDAEALAYGEAQPTGPQLAEARTMWWRQRRHGRALPAESGVIVIEGDGHA